MSIGGIFAANSRGDGIEGDKIVEATEVEVDEQGTVVVDELDVAVVVDCNNILMIPPSLF